jgi:hypothetical protein
VECRNSDATWMTGTGQWVRGWTGIAFRGP